MKKKTIGRLAAASLAVMTAATTMALPASADIRLSQPVQMSDKTYRTYAYGTIYHVSYTTKTSTAGLEQSAEVYYATEDAADKFIRTLEFVDGFTNTDKDGNTIYPNTDDIPLSKYKATKTTMQLTSYISNGAAFYVDSDQIIYKEKPAVSAEELYASTNGTGTVNPGGSTGTNNGNAYYQYAGNSIHYAGSRVYYSTVTGVYYPNYHSFYNDVSLRHGAAYTTSAYYTSTTYIAAGFISTGATGWFDPDTGTYVTYDDGNCVQIYSYNTSYDSTNYNYDSDWGTYDIYEVNGRYYPTLSSARTAAGSTYTITKVRDLNSPSTNYFSQVTGQYYTTYSAALAASYNNSSNVYTFNYYTNTTYDDPYYGYGSSTYDPYYYYWLAKQNGSSSSSSRDDGTTATIGNRTGWTSVASYLKTLKNGSSKSVAMNEETTVPSTVMSAIKGKDITVKFVLDNGATVTINGKSVSSAKSIDIDVEYNTKNVPSKLVKKAKKVNDGVSSAQISINEGSFGAEADVTVKFGTKRAGCTAKLYRYDENGNKLKLVSKAKVQSNGKVTFGDVDKGGDFVIVLS